MNYETVNKFRSLPLYASGRINGDSINLEINLPYIFNYFDFENVSLDDLSKVG